MIAEAPGIVLANVLIVALVVILVVAVLVPKAVRAITRVAVDEAQRRRRMVEEVERHER